MRNCPHCHKEIQDEAAFCRFCRRDVDPPLWLTSLQKCPFCAEWVERGIDRCPLCGKELGSPQPFSIPTEEVEEASDLLSRLRKSSFKLEDVEPAEDEEPPVDESEELEPAQEPFVDTPSWFQRMRKSAETAEPEAEEGLGVLQGRRIDLRDEFELEAEDDPRTPVGLEPISTGRNWAELSGRIFRWLLIGVIATVIVVVALLGYERIRSAPPATARPTNTIEASPTPPAQDATSSPAPTYSGTPGVLLPVTPSGPECVSWEEITLDRVGETVCVYGELRRWFQVTDIPYVAIFSEDPGTFAFIDREQTYPQFRPGTCLTAEGVIEDMRSTRPFIDVLQNLKECEASP